MRVAAALLMSLSTAACATGGGGPAPPPDLTPIPGSPLTPTARLVLACVDQAQTSGGVDMIAEDDGEGRMVRFTCTGAPAEALFAALAPRSTAIGSEWVEGGIVHRSTERMQENLYGIDFCRRDGGGHACVFNLNLGAFIGP
ncbi:MAG: hypothetical protein KJ676_00295 [Alphaproteobacteria bacterium]|nr:hypothetical protein [Alphaproteobacteria bacterium]MBU1527171.1 hypothetical protein [Alphaproteobacteria bacterium]MBU2117154.1 hypothetical protein [Alphaproteobacteria bacterium]MBU2351766.1 hypothetical protein [Alphaproteobacteria bacterium]MBU2383382.1 hypothetical protein [Alphaproteobacteria bacterium]